jgi:F-type H+-transporting ATPase subunit b
VGDYLKRLASPALEAALVDLFLADLAARAPPWPRAARGPASPHREQRLPCPRRCRPASVPAWPRAGPGRGPRWTEEPALLAGLSVHLPGHQLETSLRRGVDAFQRLEAPTAGRTQGEA